MSQPHNDFARLMQHVRDGSDEAARELQKRYGRYIGRVVRRRMPNRLRSMFDSQDFVQSVWGSFFRTLPAHVDFDGPGALARFLARIANNKVIDETRRRLMGQKHNIADVRSLDSIDTDVVEADTVQPSPSQVVMAKEERSFLQRERPAYYLQILDLRAAGATYKRIASELSLNEKTVRRVLKRLSQSD